MKIPARQGIVFLFCLFLGAAARSAENPLDLARELLPELKPTQNRYAAKGSFIRWKGRDRAASAENRTVCSTFYSILLKTAYGLTDKDLGRWLGRDSPLASHYHDAIVKENAFARVMKVQDLQAGDLIAIKYFDDAARTSGHVALMNAPARAIEAGKPLISGTRQYEVEVIDSARSGHGRLDTRMQSDGRFSDGVGKGTMRIYADASGSVQGYTWSNYANSEYFPNGKRLMVLGRLKPNEIRRTADVYTKNLPPVPLRPAPFEHDLPVSGKRGEEEPREKKR